MPCGMVLKAWPNPPCENIYKCWTDLLIFSFFFVMKGLGDEERALEESKKREKC